MMTAHALGYAFGPVRYGSRWRGDDDRRPLVATEERHVSRGCRNEAPNNSNDRQDDASRRI
jgi:hypothetical protein